jgi:hypothetical protein
LGKSRMVVAVCYGLRGEIGKSVLLNDLRIYQLTNAIIEEFLKDQEMVKVLIKRLKF